MGGRRVKIKEGKKEKKERNPENKKGPA